MCPIKAKNKKYLCFLKRCNFLLGKVIRKTQANFPRMMTALKTIVHKFYENLLYQLKICVEIL